jgi:hypothetical protein
VNECYIPIAARFPPRLACGTSNEVGWEPFVAHPVPARPWSSRRRIERHLAEARLPPGKTIDTFDFEAVPVISKAQVMALAAGDAWRSPHAAPDQPPGSLFARWSLRNPQQQR